MERPKPSKKRGTSAGRSTESEPLRWQRAELDVLKRWLTTHCMDELSDVTVWEGIRLGKWVRSLCYRYKHGEVNPALIPELEALAGWTWDRNRRRDYRRRMVRHVGEYAATHGWPALTNRTVHAGLRIGEFVRLCRWQHRRGLLHTETRRLLTQLPGWTWESQYVPESIDHAILRECLLKHGKWGIGQNFRFKNRAVGVWLQRSRERAARGRLDKATERVLSEFPGWEFNGTERPMHTRADVVCEFVSRHGLDGHDRRIRYKGVQVLLWLRNRRTEYVQGRARESIIRRLMAVPQIAAYLLRPLARRKPRDRAPGRRPSVRR